MWVSLEVDVAVGVVVTQHLCSEVLSAFTCNAFRIAAWTIVGVRFGYQPRAYALKRAVDFLIFAAKRKDDGGVSRSYFSDCLDADG